MLKCSKRNSKINIMYGTWMCVFMYCHHLTHSQTGGMMLPYNKFSSKKLGFFFFLVLCLCVCMCVCVSERGTEKERDDEEERERERLTKTTQLCVKSRCKGKIKKSTGGGFQEACLCHQSDLCPFEP